MLTWFFISRFAVTLERFLAIAFPLRSFTKKKYLLPAAITFAVVYNLPKYFEVCQDNITRSDSLILSPPLWLQKYAVMVNYFIWKMKSRDNLEVHGKGIFF